MQPFSTPSTPDMLSPDEINGMLVNQLKEELKARGASTVGKKNELCARLLELAAAEHATTEAAPASSDDSAEVPATEQEKMEETKEDTVAPATVEPSVEDNAREEQEATVAEGVDGSAAAKEEGENETAAIGSTSSQADTSVGVVVDASPRASVEDSGSASDTAPSVSVDVDSYRHVRIDNFQRPLNQKALVEWIEVQSQCKLLPESLWINAIKTHCYVDFRNEEEAQRCITKVTGQRYPATSAYTLVADFTSVSAKEAPTSEEAAKRPGEWKVVPGQGRAAGMTGAGTPGKQASQGGMSITISNDQQAMEGQEGTGAHAQSSPAMAVAGTKRRLEEPAEDGAASPVASPTAGTAAAAVVGTGESGSKARKLTGGMDIFRRATAGILLGRPGAGVSAGTKLGTVGVQPGQPSASTPSVTGLISRNGRFDEADAEGEGGEDARAEDSSSGGRSRGKGLDELFRKTVVATPSLYWLPAPDEVVQQRLKSKLKMKATNNAKK